MPITNRFNTTRKPVENTVDSGKSDDSKQLRAFGIARKEHEEVLADLLDSPDINCMGVIPPKSASGNIDDVVSKVAAMPLDILVIYASNFDDDMQMFMQLFNNSRKGVASVLITDQEITISLLQVAMACGINKVIRAEKDSQNKICDIVATEARKNQARQETADILQYKSRVLVTYSSKGGAGKTTVAVNLAAALMEKGNKVTIIDMDLASGDIHSFLGVNNAESISELAEEPGPITPAMIKSYVRQASCGLGVMCAPSAPQHANVVTHELVSKVITTLRAENDYLIIDCDQQLINGSIALCNEEAMKAADVVLFIVTPEVPTINGAYDMLHKYIERFPVISEKIRVVVNKAGSASTITSSEISKTLDRPIFASIPDDYSTVVQTLNTGVPFMYTVTQNKTPSFLRRGIVKAYDLLTDKILEIS